MISEQAEIACAQCAQCGKPDWMLDLMTIAALLGIYGILCALKGITEPLHYVFEKLMQARTEAGEGEPE